ncbi:MAG: hypothetical protein VYA34_01090 [Myxococcota bacterium]|nr:hypothetical protein [Myxococcota bacterium]
MLTNYEDGEFRQAPFVRNITSVCGDTKIIAFFIVGVLGLT